MNLDVGILSAAYHVPPATRTVRDVFRREGIEFTAAADERLGMEEVHVATREKGSQLALAAAQEAVRRAGIPPADIGVIVDFTVLPQEYLVPAWNMSNKLQHELGATSSFTVGFSGGGTTHFLISLHFAVSLLRTDDSVKAALLVAADTAIPDNRVLTPDDPVTVFGDGASAVVLQRGAPCGSILGTELWSDGDQQDVCYIPGGAMTFPDRMDLYRMVLNRDKYTSKPKFTILRELTGRLLDRAAAKMSQVRYFLYPNYSLEDQREFMKVFGVKEDGVCLSNRARFGHLQGNDFVLNYLSMTESKRVRQGDYVLFLSHGMGFTYGATLIRYGVGNE